MKIVLAIIVALLVLSQVDLPDIAYSLQQYGAVGTVSRALDCCFSPGDRNGLNPR